MRIRMLLGVLGLILSSIVVTTNVTHASAPATQAFLPLVVGRSPSSITGYPPPPSTPVDVVVSLTNDERAKVGCPALTISSQLSSAAQGHTDDMATHNLMSHTGSDGSSPWTASTPPATSSGLPPKMLPWATKHPPM